jgi:DNA-directed RNA polymerase subunit RPC12/RpoP
MAKVERVTARKDYTCSKCGKAIHKGVLYYRGNVFRQRKPIIACTDCGIRPYELSTSDYVRSVGAIVEDWQENYPAEDGAWDSIAEELQGIKDGCEESLEAMPENLQAGSTGELLQERIDTLEEAIDALGEYDMSFFLSRGYDNLSPEEQEAIDTEVDRRVALAMPVEETEFYTDFWEYRFTGTLTEEKRLDAERAAENWKEQTESEITDFIDSILGEVSY